MIREARPQYDQGGTTPTRHPALHQDPIQHLVHPGSGAAQHTPRDTLSMSIYSSRHTPFGVQSGLAVKAAYPCSNARVAWVQSLPSPMHAHTAVAGPGAEGIASRFGSAPQ